MENSGDYAEATPQELVPLARGNNGLIMGPQDNEFVHVIQSIEGEYPELEPLKEALKAALGHCVGSSPESAVLDAMASMLGALDALRSLGAIAKVEDFAVETDGNELEVTLGFVLPSGKRVSLALVLEQHLTTEISNETGQELKVPPQGGPSDATAMP